MSRVPNQAAKKILLVDDHPIMRHGMAQLIGAEQDLKVCAESGSAADALKAVEKLKPDLVIADLTLPGKHGLEFVKDVQALRPGLKMLVLSMHDEALYAERALRAGARGYLMKESAADYLIKAIRRILDGNIYLSDSMAGVMLEMVAGNRQKGPTPTGLDRLTDRELEVLQLIGQGRGTRQIADQLHVSVRTIDAHRAHIKEKLQLPDGNALMRYAVRWMESQNQQ